MLFQLPHIPAGDSMLFKLHRKFYSVLQGGMDAAPSFPKACDVLLRTPGALLDLFSPDKENREFKLNYLKKLLDHNNIMSPRGAWKRRVSPSYSGVGYAISILW